MLDEGTISFEADNTPSDGIKFEVVSSMVVARRFGKTRVSVAQATRILSLVTNPLRVEVDTEGDGTTTNVMFVIRGLNNLSEADQSEVCRRLGVARFASEGDDVYAAPGTGTLVYYNQQGYSTRRVNT